MLPEPEQRGRRKREHANMRIEAKIKKALQFIDDRTKWGKLITEHLEPCGDDKILLVLKGHCVIESLLESILIRQLDIESMPTGKGRLDFIKKLKLVQVLVEQRKPGPNADLFLAIDALNELRNQMAHKLKHEKEIEKDVHKFIDEYHKRVGTKSCSHEALPMQLRNCIVKLCKLLDDVISHFYKLEQEAQKES
jgi:hypothetical protein